MLTSKDIGRISLLLQAHLCAMAGGSLAVMGEGWISAGCFAFGALLFWIAFTEPKERL